MILTIKKLDKKEEDTQYGKKIKFYITFEEKPDKIVSSFEGKWNSTYQEQTRLDVNAPGEDKDANKPTLDIKEAGDRTYYNLKAPETAKGGFDTGRIESLESRVSDLADRIGVLEYKANSKGIGDMPAPHIDNFPDGTPVTKEEIPLPPEPQEEPTDNIPF